MPRLLFVFLLLQNVLLAQSGSISIPFAHQNMQIDGDTSDWETQSGIPFREDTAQIPFANSVRVCLAWDEEHLYGLFIVKDKHLVKLKYGENNPSLFLNDAIEIYLDAHNNSGKRMDLDDYQLIVDAGGETVLFKGDKHKIIDSTENYVPKEAGIANILYHSRVKIAGTLNQNNDLDDGYVIEIAIPWVAIGVSPAAGYLLRLDVGLDDADTVMDLTPLKEEDKIPNYQSITWNGNRNFGFPTDWVEGQLTGSPSFFKKCLRQYPDLPLYLTIGLGILLLIFVPTFWLQFRQIRALKNLPARQNVVSSTLLEVTGDQTIGTGHPTATEKVLAEKNSKYAALIGQARAWVLNHLSENISPEQMARVLTVSLRNLQRIFREEMDLTPGQFILMIKLEKAAQMLRSGDLSVSEVAYQLGFSNPAYFSSVFKKYFNCAPSEIRQMS